VLARRERDAACDDGGDEHLHCARLHEIAASQPALQHRAERPGDRRRDAEPDRAERQVLAAARRDEVDHAGESDPEPERAEARQPLAIEQRAERGHPERREREEERADSARQALESGSENAVARDEQQRSDDSRIAPLARRRQRRTAEAAPNPQQRARRREAHRNERERRQRFDAHADRGRGRPPEHVDEPEGNRDGEPPR